MLESKESTRQVVERKSTPGAVCPSIVVNGGKVVLVSLRTVLL